MQARTRTILRKLQRVLTARHLAGHRAALLWSYLRLLVLARLADVLPIRASRVRLLGFEIAPLSLGELVYLFEEIFIEAEYALSPTRPGAVIIDCGANIGVGILYQKWRQPSARIVAFEPNPAAFEKLQRNVRRNRLRGVTAHRLAVGREEGQLRFFGVATADGQNSLTVSGNESREPGSWHLFTADGTRLSSMFDGRVDLLKLDVEGAELDVLLDLVETGKIRNVDQMIVELHHSPLGDSTVPEFLRSLQDCGFSYHVDSRAGRPLQPDPTTRDVLVHAWQREPPTPSRRPS